MVTYFYWFLVLAIMGGTVYIVGYKMEQWKNSAIAAVIIFVIGNIAYYFHFEQIFVKRFGGVMSIKVPDGQLHLAATWKDDNLWIENFDPKTNTCHFREYSRGNLLEGHVVIKNCNPLLRKSE
ncbi:MAG: hypothetical protein OEY52_07550 [Gammaproteobacteria bacterium]|nr:hypothetical protein [Gammaproteobacteria bacterium]